MARFAPRCNYCEKPSAARFSWTSRVLGSVDGRKRTVTVTVRACAEHVGCPNWESHRKQHPETAIEIETAVRS